MDCIFNTPVTASGTQPQSGDYWQFQNASCTDPYVSQLSNGTNTVFIDARISYGDIFVVVFLLIFLGIVVWSSIVNFILPKTIKPLQKGDI